MAKGGSTIVIKKITIGGAGAHGGAWKVAFADFMTALMAFFLLMWLLGQSSETKKAVAEYFSTPSLVEYNFTNFGAELTLEKLFLDLINEPLKAVQSLVEPADMTPNMLDFGSKKMVLAYVEDQLRDYAKNAQVDSDSLQFDIPDYLLFQPGTAKLSPQHTPIMEKVRAVTQGLENTNLRIYSMLFTQAVVDGQTQTAEKVASERLDIISKNIGSALEHPTVTIIGKTQVQPAKSIPEGKSPAGMIRFHIEQKETNEDGQKQRKLDEVFGKGDPNMNVYDNFVKQVTDVTPAKKKPKEE